MSTFIAAFVIFLLAIVMMGLGAMVHGRALKGSCGNSCTCSPMAARTCDTRRK